MSGVSTSSQAIKEAINICNRAIEMLRATQRGMNGKYIEAGTTWNDSKYQKLGDIVGDCDKSINKALMELDACLSPLASLEASIKAYEEVNISGSVSSANSGFSNNAVRNTPVNNGSWSGERGNSIWRPTNEAVLADLQFYGNGADGIEYRDGYADFTPVQVYECKLPIQLYYRNDEYQFVDCTLELREHLREHHDLISYFDDEQLSAIGRGQDRIPGYTWHHDVQTGRMQLIPTSIHSTCPHEGGQSIWGGGSSNR